MVKVAAAPFMLSAYVTGQGILQVLGFVLVFIGSIPAALALLSLSKLSPLSFHLWIITSSQSLDFMASFCYSFSVTIYNVNR